MATEKLIDVRPIEVHLICDCGGEMLPTGMVLESYPPQYPHVCQRCNKQTTAFSVYPHIKYVPVSDA